MNFRHIETPFFILLHSRHHNSGDAIFAHSIGIFHFAILLQYPISLFFYHIMSIFAVEKMKNIVYYEKDKTTTGIDGGAAMHG